MWDSIKYEILNVQEESLAEEALAVLQAIAIKLSHGLTSTDDNTALGRYLKPITKECTESLHEPQHKQAKPAAQILSSVGTASIIAFCLVIKAVLPPLLTVYQAADDMSATRALLEIFVQLFDASIIVYDPSIIKVSDLIVENPLCLFKDRLFEMFGRALMSTSKDETSLRIAALKALRRLCQLHGFLDKNEVGLVIHYCQEIYLDEDDFGHDDLKKEAIEALLGLSLLYAQQITETTIPALIARLPDYCEDGGFTYLIPLQGLAQLGNQDHVFGMVVRRLVSKLDIVIQQKGNSASYPEAILIALTYVFKNRNLASDPNLSEYVEKVVHGLVGRAALGASMSDQATLLNNALCIEPLGRLAGTIVGSLDHHKQRAVGLRVYALEENRFRPVPFRDREATEPERLTMILSTYLLASAGPSVGLSLRSVADC